MTQRAITTTRKGGLVRLLYQPPTNKTRRIFMYFDKAATAAERSIK